MMSSQPQRKTEANRAVSVAIADDHEISVTGLSEIVSELEGFFVSIIANDGKELYDKIRQSEKVPNIVILDISMPVWDGYQTIGVLKKEWPEIKVLIMTMHKHEMGVIKMFKSGAGGYLMKNSKPQEIKNALSSIHETGYYFSEIVSRSMFNKLQYHESKVSLTEKELQLLRHCASDLTYKEIADKMKTNERNVHAYRVSLFEKFNVNKREALVICALQMGILHIG